MEGGRRRKGVLLSLLISHSGRVCKGRFFEHGGIWSSCVGI